MPMFGEKLNKILNKIGEREEKLLKYILFLVAIIMIVFAFINFKKGYILVSTLQFIAFLVSSVLLYITTLKKMIQTSIIILLILMNSFTLFFYTQKEMHYTIFI
jgi:hypothetical protein